MADGRSSNDDSLPVPYQLEDGSRERGSSSIHVLDNEAAQLPEKDTVADNSFPSEPRTSGEGPAPVIEEPAQATLSPVLLKQFGDVVSSEIGISTLLNRLKQSITSAKEFATFLKKRSVIEDDHAQTLKKLVRATQENMHRAEHRQGTFSQAYNEIMFIHDRMAENGSNFAASLQQMHEDLNELIQNTDRSRKVWKANGLSAEQKVADMDQTMRKSKAKYDSLAEEYDRARTGEARQGGKVLGAFKAHKSAAQQEEDLLKKVQGADQTYQGHVQALQSEKSQLVSSIRPEAVKALQNLVSEMDSAVALQMQKFASFNEKLLLGNGLTVSPFTGQEGSGIPQRRSLRQAVSSIDNDRDLHEFVGAHHAKVPITTEVKYERNPVLGLQGSSLNPAPQAQVTGPLHAPQQSGTHSPPPFSNNQPHGADSRSNTFAMGGPPAPGQPPFNQGGPPPGGQGPSQFQPPPHSRSFSQGNTLNQQGPPPQQFGVRNSSQAAPGYGHNGPASGPPQLGALPFQSGPPVEKSAGGPQGPAFQPPRDPRGGPGPQVPPSMMVPPGPPPAYGGAAPGSHGPPQSGLPNSSKPVFGIPLNRLYERDGLAVPLVVYQCVQAVDLFGLGVEGIYRQSGSMNHINKLKAMFDADSSNPALDFRNPENFYHDINSVTGLLKLFLRDLPDPLLTLEQHDRFIAAAKKEDDTARRYAMHEIINSLADPNYATLRALALHLHRITDNAHLNRMNSHNLAVILGPTLMGSDPSTAIKDAGWQIKAIQSILENTYQIFDED